MRAKFWKLFQNRNFLRLWFSLSLSQVTAYLLNFVLMVKIFQTTGSTTALSVFLAIYTAPSVFLGLFSGAVVDLVNRKKILLYANLLQALIALFYLGVSKNVWMIYGIVFFYSLCDEFSSPASGSLLPDLVEKKDLSLANTLLLFSYQGAMLVGYTLGGPLMKIFGSWAPYPLASILLLLSANFVKKIPDNRTSKWRQIKSDELVIRVLDDVKEGYLFIKKEIKVWVPFLFYILSEMLIGVTLILFPSIAKNIFRINIEDAGLAVLLPVGAGAILGSFFIERKKDAWGKKKTIALGALMGGVSFLLISQLGRITNFSRLILKLLLTILGAGGIFIIIPSITMVQENTPSQIRGRVFGALSALTIIASYLPIFMAAGITDILGINWTLAIIGIGLLILGVFSSKIDRRYLFGASNRS